MRNRSSSSAARTSSARSSGSIAVSRLSSSWTYPELAVATQRCNTFAIVEVVLSSRRGKKGPGRRPLAAKRQRFMECVNGGGVSARQRVRLAFPGPRGTIGHPGRGSIGTVSWSESCRRWIACSFGRSAHDFSHKTSGSISPTCTALGFEFGRSPRTSNAHPRRSRGSCVAIVGTVAGIALSTLISELRLVVLGTTCGVLKPIVSSPRFWSSYFCSGGARSR